MYKLKTDGTLYSVLRFFGATTNEGTNPIAGVIPDGLGRLYGVTYAGGSANSGSIFSIKVDGTGFEALHDFTGISDDGSYPNAALVLGPGGRLYGATSRGGTNGFGTVFRIDTGGTGFLSLRSFAGLPDGAYPTLAGLIVDSSGVLYGATWEGGGRQNMGTLFSLQADGSGFETFYAFHYTEGISPVSSLLADGSQNLYGTTEQGGLDNLGTVFELRRDGSGFSTLHDFSEPNGDGAFPDAPVIFDGDGNLFGTTSTTYGSGPGAVFRLLPGAGYSLLHTFGSSPDGGRPLAALALVSPSTLVGTASNGGQFAEGTIFALKTDGTSFQVLHDFAVSDGVAPSASVVSNIQQQLFGTTAGGGASGQGTIYTIGTTGTGFSVLHSFVGGSNDGAQPLSAVVIDAFGFLYGTTSAGGPANRGVVFRMKTDGSMFSVLHGFAGGMTDGDDPPSSLTLDGSGNLYGTTYRGGVSNAGVIFRMKTDGGGFTLLHSFAGFPQDGGYPTAALILDEYGNLYGTTSGGGAGSGGIVFKLGEANGGGASLAAPVITAPAQGQVLASSRVVFKWGIVNQAADYQFLVVDDSDGSTIYSGSNTDGSTTATIDLPNGGLTFGVRACSGGFADANCGPFATVDFTVNVLPPTTSTTKFYTLTPCRVADTRNAAGPYGGPALQAGVSRVFKLTGQCGIPTGVKAASVNITVVTPTDPGELKLNPTGADPQVASAISFPAGRVLANNAMVFLGTDGAMSVFDAQDTGSTHFIIDVNGYFK